MSSSAQEPMPEPQKSTHKVEVVRVFPEKHPNADKLEIVMVFGYSVCVGKGELKQGDLAVYIPPDSVVPERPEFSWIWEAKGYTPAPYTGQGEELNIPVKYRRVKAKILRGVVSEGLLIPVAVFPELTNSSTLWEGNDVADILGITHYDPPENDSLLTDCEVGPTIARKKTKRGYPRTLKGWYHLIKHWFSPSSSVYGSEETTAFSYTIPIYDIAAWQRYKHILKEGEEVWITEKIHGANCRFTYIQTNPNDLTEGRLYVGSHRQWKKDVAGSAFWEVVHQNSWIKSFCYQFPALVLYGELVPTQTLNYGQEKGHYRVFGFDVFDPAKGKWLSYEELQALHFQFSYQEGGQYVSRGLLDEIHWVPTVAIVPYSESSIRQFASGSSLVEHATHKREGIVIKPMQERIESRFGRVILKIVSAEFLASKNSE